MTKILTNSMSKPFENSRFFQRNIQALSRVDTPLTNALISLENLALNAPLRFVPTNDDNIFDALNKTSVYQNALLEFNHKKAFFEENYPKHPVLFIFGFGNGKLIKHLLGNLRHKRIIVFECELELIYHALRSFDLENDIKKERLIPFYVPNLMPSQLDTLFSYKDIKTSVKTYNFTSNCGFYERHYAAELERLHCELMENVRFAFLRKGNDPQDSLIGIEHTLQHLPKMLARPSCEELWRKRKGAAKTAIIVSTGPSLNKQLGLLKRYAPYASVICADSAYAILHKHGIKPDYVVSLERVPLTAELFNNDFKDFDKDITFVLVSFTHPNTIANLEKNKRNYMIALRPSIKYLKLDEWGYLGHNHSASNMAYELAMNLGHERILLIGQDLAYGEDGVSHSKDYKLLYYHEKDFERDKGRFLVPAYGGEGEVQSSAVWILFKQGFESDIAAGLIKHKCKGYNCTEGGARIDGAIEMPFKEACEEFLNEDLKKPFKELSSLNESEAKALLSATKKRLESSLKKNDLYLNEVKKELENLRKLLPNDYEFDKLDFKALTKSKQKLAALHERFTKSVFFTEIIDVSYYQNNCELVRLDCVVCKSEREEKELLLQWLATMANWFIEAGEWLYTQNECINKQIQGYEL